MRMIVMKQEIEIPFQVENLIKQMLDKADNVYVRGNFRSRLDHIREVINQSIKKYDTELYMADSMGRNPRKKTK